MKDSSPTSRTLGRLRSIRAYLAVLTTALIACAGGCSSPVVVPAAGPRPPLRADQVSIYQKEPGRYELHGAVAVTRSEGAEWDERGNADVAFDALKAKAAALGANGLLLSAEPGTYDRLATAGYHGTFYQIPIRGNPPEAFAKAIYVSGK